MDGAILRLLCIIILSLYHFRYSGTYVLDMYSVFNLYVIDGQVCTDQVNIQQNGDSRFGPNRLAIFPRLNFTCSGRITNIRARVASVNVNNNNFLSIQVWRQSSPGSTRYTRIDTVQLQSNQVTTGSGDFLKANITLTGDDRIEFLSGDVIGYYNPNNLRYTIRDIRTDGYFLYRFDGSPAPISVNLENRNQVFNFRQPLLQFTVGQYMHISYSTVVLYIGIMKVREFRPKIITPKPA